MNLSGCNGFHLRAGSNENHFSPERERLKPVSDKGVYRELSRAFHSKRRVVIRRTSMTCHFFCGQIRFVPLAAVQL